MKKILVIDDYADVAEMIAANLETQLPDLEVVTASECLESLQIFLHDF